MILHSGISLLQALQEQLCRRSKDLILLPDNVQTCGHSRLKWTEAQRTVHIGVGDTVDTYGIAYASLDHYRRVVHEVEGSDDVQLLKIAAEPVDELVVLLAAAYCLP